MKTNFTKLSLLSILCCSLFSITGCNEECNHNIVIDPSRDPSCTSYGKTEGSHCGKCKEVIVAQERIGKTPHKYIIDFENYGDYNLHCDTCGNNFEEHDCTNIAGHEKGTLLDLITAKVDGYTKPGLYKCKHCEEEYIDNVTQKEIGLPVVSLDGDFSGISKENKKKIVVTYESETLNFSYPTKIKWQGGSSLEYPKKNYNIQFFKDKTYDDKQKVKIVEEWGKQSKYTLKANYVDYCQIRNIVTANIYADMVKSNNIDDQYSKLFGGGAVDGFPIVVYQNNEFQGLYTYNTSKDDYIFGMKGDETTKEAILMAGDWKATCGLTEEMNGTFTDGWELEYCSTEDTDTSWVKTSFNNLINFLNNSSDADFIKNINDYTNVDRAIDSMLLTWVCKAQDNIAKNIIWSTFDGQHWVPSVYDLDATWGLYWNGNITEINEAYVPYQANQLWKRIYKNFNNKIVNRYKELRTGALSLMNIDKHFVETRNKIPAYLYELDSLKWKDVPSQKTNHITQIMDFARKSLKYLDGYFGITKSSEMGFRVSFNLPTQVTAKVFFNRDYTGKSDQTKEAIARDGETGLISTENAEISFKLTLPKGFYVERFNITNFDGEIIKPLETGANNVYRLMGINSDITIGLSLERAD